MKTLPLPAVRASRVVLDLLFPRWCIGCGKEGEFLCNSCLATAEYIDVDTCPRCGRPITNSANCNNCSHSEWIIDSIRAPFIFHGVIREAVHQFKYRNLRALAPLFAISLYDCLKNKPFDIDVIVPVPLHSRRLRERGYNQSALLAHELSRLLDIPCVENRLVRRIATPSLVSSASREARLALVSQAFETRGGDFAGKHVLLVDDVSTSGATFNACARVLREAGAVKIHGIALALEL